MRRILLVLAIVPIAVVPALPLGADAAEGDSPLFSFQSLERPGRAVYHRLADLDGDGDLDLVLVTSDPDDDERFRVHSCLQSAGGRFASTDCGVRDLAESVRSVDAADWDAEPGAELLILGKDGASAASLVGNVFGPPRTIPGVTSVVSGSDPYRPMGLTIAFDLDFDGRNELVVPTLAGPVIHWAGGRTLALDSPARIRYRVDVGEGGLSDGFAGHAKVRRTSTTQLSPDAFVVDFDGDGRLDVVTLVETELRVFRQTAPGAFAPPRIIERTTLSEAEEKSRFSGERATFADFDGDGRMDLVITKWGSEEERSQIDRALFFARGDGSYPEEPDQVVRTDSAIPIFFIRDLDGDGRLDMVVPYFHIAVAQALKVLTENAVKLQLRTFVLQPDGRFPQAPDKRFPRVHQRIPLEYELDLMGLFQTRGSQPRGDLAPVLDVNADVNGDGHSDLLADSGSDELRIYLGNSEARYRSRPDHEIELESSLSYSLVDANGDGKTDVFTFYGATPVRERPEFAVGKRQREELRKQRRRERERGTAAVPAAPKDVTRIKILLSR